MNKKLFKLASEKHLEQFQIMKIKTEKVDINTFNEKIDKFEISIIENYVISGLYQDKEVRLYTESLEENIIEELIEQAEYLDVKTLPTTTNLENIRETKTYQINNLDDITTKMLNLNKFKSKYHNLKEINSYYTENVIERTITTETNELYDTKKEKNFEVKVVISENGKNSTAHDSKSNIDDSDIDLEALTKEVIQNAIDKLSYQEIQSGTYKVILTSKVMGNILNELYGLFSADKIQKDISLLKQQKNELNESVEHLADQKQLEKKATFYDEFQHRMELLMKHDPDKVQELQDILRTAKEYQTQMDTDQNL